MNFSCGLVSRKGKKASEDAYIVERLKDAGAILIAVTNIPEINLWIETRNPVYGQTKNPFNTNKIVGGSSGGEVSLLLILLYTTLNSGGKDFLKKGMI